VLEVQRPSTGTPLHGPGGAPPGHALTSHVQFAAQAVFVGPATAPSVHAAAAPHQPHAESERHPEQSVFAEHEWPGAGQSIASVMNEATGQSSEPASPAARVAHVAVTMQKPQCVSAMQLSHARCPAQPTGPVSRPDPSPLPPSPPGIELPHEAASAASTATLATLPRAITRATYAA
jgi:hypothetical protein